MATIANLLLKNYAAVDVTFAPDTVQTGEYAKYADRTQGTFLGTNFASITRKINPAVTGVRKIQGKLTRPTINATTGALDFTLLGTVEFIMPNAATLAQKRELQANMKTLVGHAVMVAAVENDEMPWG